MALLAHQSHVVLGLTACAVLGGCYLAHERGEVDAGGTDAFVAPPDTPGCLSIEVMVTAPGDNRGGMTIHSATGDLLYSEGDPSGGPFQYCAPIEDAPLRVRYEGVADAIELVGVSESLVSHAWGGGIRETLGLADYHAVLQHQQRGSHYLIQVGPESTLDTGDVDAFAFGCDTQNMGRGCRARFVELSGDGHLLGAGAVQAPRITPFTLNGAGTTIATGTYHVSLPTDGMLAGAHVIGRDVVRCDQAEDAMDTFFGVVDMWRCTRVGIALPGASTAASEDGTLEYDASERPGNLSFAIHISTTDAVAAGSTEAFALVPCCGQAPVEVSFRQPTMLSARAANVERHGVVFSAASDFDHAYVDYCEPDGTGGETHGVTLRGGSVSEATVMDDVDSFAVPAVWVGVMDTDGREPWEDGSSVLSVRRLVAF